MHVYFNKGFTPIVKFYVHCQKYRQAEKIITHNIKLDLLIIFPSDLLGIQIVFDIIEIILMTFDVFLT